MEPWLNLLIQIPLVGIFVWFVLQQTKVNNQSMAERDAEWRLFLREQREASNIAMGRLADEIKVVAQKLSGVETAQAIHDQRVQVGFSDIKDALARRQTNRS